MQLPIIKFNTLGSASLLNDALSEIGFAIITNHPLKRALIEDTCDEWLQFFNSNHKFQYPFINKTQEGYFPFRSANAKGNQFKDLMEFYNVYIYRLYPREVSTQALELHAKLSEIAVVLLEWLDNSMPAHIRSQLEMSLVEMVTDSPKHLMRIIHYPPIASACFPNEVRSAAHEDGNLLTLLPAPTMPGLQLKDKQGTWHDVLCNKNDLIINVGEMLRIVSDNYYRSATHRVINYSPEVLARPRMSTPFFTHPRDEVYLAPQLTAKQFLNSLLNENSIYSFAK